MNLNARQIPVFVFPSCLKFYIGTKNSHSQILTLYSPYDFPVKYKVLCPTGVLDKYVVPSPEGTIPVRSSINLVISHKQIIPANINVHDKIQIVIQDPVTGQLIGRKKVEAVLLPGDDDSKCNEDDFEFHNPERSVGRSIHGAQTIRTSSSRYPQTLPYDILCWPNESDSNHNSLIPSYLHVTHNIKLAAAFACGVVFTLLLKP